jgi:hypothetical protein
MKNIEHQGGQQFVRQREFDEAISRLANMNYEMFVRALVHLEDGKLTVRQFEQWLKNDAGLLNHDLYS